MLVQSRPDAFKAIIKVVMISKYHNHKMQTKPRHREEELQDM